MDFTLTETQTMLGDAVDRFLADHHDFETRKKQLSTGESHNPGLWQGLAELGLMGVAIDGGFGGSGMGFEDLAVVLERFGGSLVTEPFVPTVILVAGLLQSLGSEEQQRHWLPLIADGSVRAALAHGERQARDLVQWVATNAAKTADGWQLNGAKMVVLGGDVADLFLVSARNAGQPDESDGISLFAVPRALVENQLRPYSLYDGSGACELILDGVTLPCDALVGREGDALTSIEAAYDQGAAAISVQAVGAMKRLRDLTLDYIKIRRQFGQPLGSFQALQHRMVDLHMAVEIAESMALSAVIAITADPDERMAKVSAAKAAVGQAAREVGQSAVQLHGGIALTDEYIAGHYFKKLTLSERQFGRVDYHLDRYARLMKS
jgi:alkylation response protein AidB-like acyl-CoA dehydrogenase